MALRFGVALVPNSYYSSVPDINVLRATRNIWARKSDLIGVCSDLRGQVHRLYETCSRFEPEYRGNRTFLKGCASDCGPGFGYVEAMALHGFLRHFKPTKIIEVGCGVSTYCVLAAAALNESEGSPHCEVTCVEPYPRPWLARAPVRMLAQPVQKVDPKEFEDLSPGSLLFIDSSHAVKTGSDSNYLILEVLPRLQRGVLVHFHDIYLPYDYGPDALETFLHWQETVLLHAFLIGNRNVRVLFSLSQLHCECPKALARTFPEYEPCRTEDGLFDPSRKPFAEPAGHFPSSTYLEIVGDHRTT